MQSVQTQIRLLLRSNSIMDFKKQLHKKEIDKYFFSVM